MWEERPGLRELFLRSPSLFRFRRTHTCTRNYCQLMCGRQANHCLLNEQEAARVSPLTGPQTLNGWELCVLYVVVYRRRSRSLSALSRRLRSRSFAVSGDFPFVSPLGLSRIAHRTPETRREGGKPFRDSLVVKVLFFSFERRRSSRRPSQSVAEWRKIQKSGAIDGRGAMPRLRRVL